MHTYVSAGVLGEGGHGVERHRPDLGLVDGATVLSEMSEIVRKERKPPPLGGVAPIFHHTEVSETS